MHKLGVIVLLIGGTAVLAKTTDVGSYAGTLWSRVRGEAKRQISTKFEIERARHELRKLDKDIAAMIRPLAEHKAGLQQLEKELEQTQANLDNRRGSLLRLTQQLEKGPRTVRIGLREVSAEKAQASLQRDFEGFQRLERHQESLHKLQDAKRSALDSAQEQLAKLVSKKREFEVRLAQLEADEETLRIASIGNPIAVDDNRASAIEAALREIEQRQQVRRAELELAQGDLVTETLGGAVETPRTDLAGIRTYLERQGGQ